MRFATVTTGELDDRCSAGRGWERNPRAKPETDPRPERMLSAEPDPAPRHIKSTRHIQGSPFVSMSHIKRWGPLSIVPCWWETVRAHPNLIAEENINREEEQPDAEASSYCGVAQSLQESRVGLSSYTTVSVWVPTWKLEQMHRNNMRCKVLLNVRRKSWHPGYLVQVFASASSWPTLRTQTLCSDNNMWLECYKCSVCKTDDCAFHLLTIASEIIDLAKELWQHGFTEKKCTPLYSI